MGNPACFATSVRGTLVAMVFTVAIACFAPAMAFADEVVDSSRLSAEAGAVSAMALADVSTCSAWIDSTCYRYDGNTTFLFTEGR